MKFILSILASILCGCLNSKAQGLVKLPENFVTSGLNKVTASKSSYLVLLKKAKWPKFNMLPALKKRMGGPTTVWRVKDGYFVSIDRGEFGGVFLYADEEDLNLIPLSRAEMFGIGTYVSQIIKLDEHTYVAAGGLAHMGMDSGAILMIKIEKNFPVIKHKVVSRVNAGIPLLHGLSRAFLGGGDALAVYSVSGHDNKNQQLYGISNNGTVHHLGKYSEKFTKRDKQELQLLIDIDKKKAEK